MIKINQNSDYQDFDPWPFLYRILGLIILILGFTLLSKQNSEMILLSKLLILSSGIIFGWSLKWKSSQGYMGLNFDAFARKRKISRAFSSLFLVSGVFIGISNLIPIVNTTIILFIAGTSAIFYGALLISKRSEK